MAGRAGLVLTGGGARAAYQVGVLDAIRELCGPRAANPFDVVCGTSAGGINAVALAVFADNFNLGVRKLTRMWRNFHVDHIYRADAAALIATGARWGSALTTGWLIPQTPRSLLDNAPLRSLLDRALDFEAIQSNIDAGHLHAVSVSASSYSSGNNIAFFEAHAGVKAWHRAQRLGVRTRIGLEHLMATGAIPFVFPAVQLRHEFFGDGSMRQLAPVSPAIHLGAERILVIGAGRLAREGLGRDGRYPSPAHIAGHALSSIFLDSLSADLERMERINQTVKAVDPAQREAAGLALRPIETLVISPSQQLDAIAARHREELPRMLRTVLRGVGGMRRGGSMLLSYLLFEPPYLRELIELGRRDALAREKEVRAFLRLPTQDVASLRFERKCDGSHRRGQM